jgi:hypothetical protein
MSLIFLGNIFHRFDTHITAAIPKPKHKINIASSYRIIYPHIYLE